MDDAAVPPGGGLSTALPPAQAQIGWLDRLQRFPWKRAALIARERFRQDHLALSASSLTFMTTIALVPFATVALALFTAFPQFARLQITLQRWLVDSLIPDSIARQVLGYLSQFAGKASRLGSVGLAVLFVTALALVLTIDRTLNAIWRVRKPRPLWQRVLVYWTTITLGPLLLALSVSLTTYALSVSKGILGTVSGGVGLALDAVQFVLLAAGMAAMYRYVPNTRVHWRHAWAGGWFVAAAFEIGKRLLVWYLAKVPTYSVLYGTFATVPILLVWIYIAWVIVLLGAVLAAYLPSLQANLSARPQEQGWQFALALDVLCALDATHHTPRRGLPLDELGIALGVEPVQLEGVVDALVTLDWVARLQEEPERLVLLIDPDTTPLEPLVCALLLACGDVAWWRRAPLPALRVRDAMRGSGDEGIKEVCVPVA
ncbi:YihY family inner membrane protein [Candidatus Symbiobacter mobilis]|uniref:UPF0761 membrane protein Cenrod_0948 n=1 Tax=Candidatus Symbiobacter mobilis CR TaxID=946483 RepID=U5N6Y3_9BURK|nr:YhjD/YihY/BrkB family envelope integrity protein [Candidatus Symbiobacter mobilis]AGX87050.1 hypothetical protein Cenrod_0948 [Candidatus Symbiobacter mobilis CR]